MTPQERQHLVDLIQAAFERARKQGIEPPIDLAPFGLLLREIEPGFSHQPYGHEKLLYLLRNEFADLLHIRKDPEAVPPRYAVSIRHGSPLAARALRPKPLQLAALKATDPGLVNGAVLERFLDRLAESSATIQHRFNDIDRRLIGIRGELDQSRANEVRLHSHTQGLEKKNEELERHFIQLSDQLKRSRGEKIIEDTQTVGNRRSIIKSNKINKKTKEYGIVVGDVEISCEFEMWGVFSDDVTVKSNGILELYGTVAGDLTVDVGGRVTIFGTVDGSVINNGEIIIGGPYLR